MIIKKISIKKFRGFQNVNFPLGKHLTIIAGQNGTQKTTILGMLSQPFTISDAENPMKDEKPLSGGSFKSGFSDKFKLSDAFDKPKEHERSLEINGEEKPFILESIIREKGKPGVRFWRKNDRSKGSGYIQLPVIFLSLKRLLPIGEDNKLEESSLQELTPEEKTFFIEHHEKILLSRDEISEANYLESPDKNTLGINTSLYDWRQNSAGQDNIGKILLAILSFKRLKEKYKEKYKGGILAIDELDATLYPASQIKLIEFLRKFSSKYDIQIIFTTHSLSILEKTCSLQDELNTKEATRDQVKVLFLQKQNHKIIVIPDISINSIRNKLNVTIGEINKHKINAFTEDREGAIFAKALLKAKSSKINFVDCKIGANELVGLASRKILSFSFPEAIVFLDGDIIHQHETMKKIQKLKNFIIMPSGMPPEIIIAKYLHNLDDASEVWSSIHPDFDKQYCFRDYTLADIEGDRDRAKVWFGSHLRIRGRNASKVINPRMKDNSIFVEEFQNNFKKTYNLFAKELGIREI